MSIVLPLICGLTVGMGIIEAVFPELIPLLEASDAGEAANAADTSISANVDVSMSSLTLASHLSGDHLQDYSSTGDGVMQKAETYWSAECGGSSSCYQSVAQSGSLQCVEFVTAVFNQAGIPLPVAHDAYQFWADYHNRPNWKEIPAKLPPTTEPTAESNGATGMPAPGDIVVYMNQVNDPATGKYKLDDTGSSGLGHVAVVVATVPPNGDTAGKLFVAQANGPSNVTAGQALTMLAGNEGTSTPNAPKIPGIQLQLQNIPLYQLTINPGGWIDDPGYQDQAVVGYIRYVGKPVDTSSNPAAPQETMSPDEQSVKTTLPSMVQPQWFPVAWDDAVKNGIPPDYYVKQIYVGSKFDPTAVSRDPKTRAPIAYGIAQFRSDAALADGVNPNDPMSALNGAAKLMRTSYCHYLGSGDCDQLIANSTAQERNDAYAKALAAYNAGQITVDNAVKNCGEANWFACLSSDVQTYVRNVAGS